MMTCEYGLLLQTQVARPGCAVTSRVDWCGIFVSGKPPYMAFKSQALVYQSSECIQKERH